MKCLYEMASWKPPGSILDAPGFDFGGSGPRFWPILKNSGIDFSATSWLESVSYQQVRISWFRPKFMTVFHLACQNVGFHFPMSLRRCSPADARLKCMAIPQRSCTQVGRRRWPPLGEFNPPPSEGVQCMLDHQPNRPQLNAKINRRWRI